MSSEANYEKCFEMADDHEQSRRLHDFIAESNRIEGIHREPTEAEVSTTKRFLTLDHIDIPDLEALVRVYQPDARLRDKPGLNVRVGNHTAPLGGREVRICLEELLGAVNAGTGVVPGGIDPFDAHVRYEQLHPFMDGNGRSGRALWAWQMWGQGYRLEIGFLHKFYYQTLAAQQGTA